MDLSEFWRSQRSTIISAIIAIVVIAGLFVLFNALPAGQPAEPADEEKQEQTKEEEAKKDEEKKEEEAKKDEKAELPAKYTVKTSDNLWKISQDHYGTGYKWAAIAAANKISNPNHISIGAKLNIPKTRDYKVQAGDTLWGIAEKVLGSGFEWTKIRDANPEKIGILPNGNEGLIYVGQTLVIPE